MVTTKCLLIFLCHLMSLLLFIELTCTKSRINIFNVKKNIQALSTCLIKKIIMSSKYDVYKILFLKNIKTMTY